MEQTTDVKTEETNVTPQSPESMNPQVNGLIEKDGMLLHPEGGAYSNPDHPSNPPEGTITIDLSLDNPPIETVPPGGHMEGTEPQTTTESTEIIDTPAPIEGLMTEDEQIISDWLKNGKTEVTTNELTQAGFDISAFDPHTVEIGRYKLSRLLLVSPYKIEKIVK